MFIASKFVAGFCVSGAKYNQIHSFNNRANLHDNFWDIFFLGGRSFQSSLKGMFKKICLKTMVMEYIC